MLSDVYFPRINGVSTSIQAFRRQFAALGHEVLLIAPSYPTGTDPETGILRIPARTVPFDPEDRVMGLKAALHLEPALRERRFDLVHIQTPFVAHYAGVALSERLGLPRVETYHTFFAEYLHHYVPLVPRAWTRAAARRFSRAQCNDLDAVVVPSRAMHRVLREYGVRSRIEIIPTGIDPDRLSGGSGPLFRERHAIPPERPVLVHVGRLAFEKNIDFLLRMLVHVCDQIPAALLVIAGEGPSRAHLQRLGHRLGLERNVLFLGYLDRRNALLDCYRAGDAFVFASRTETQGLVLLEAMALGVPVVSTAVMGTREILEGGRGALVAEENEAQFAAAVVALLRDPARRRTLSREAQHCASEWAAPCMAARMLELYASVLEASGGRVPAGGRLEKTALL
jgi:glycosyltransferase involved in cell wall biosynthesis